MFLPRWLLIIGSSLVFYLRRESMMISTLCVQRELEDVLEELDVDQSGGIDFAEFLQFMIK